MGYSKLTFEDFVEHPDQWDQDKIPKWSKEIYEDFGGEPVCAIDFYDDIFSGGYDDEEDDLEEHRDPEDYRTGEYGAIAMEIIYNKKSDCNEGKTKRSSRARRTTVTKGCLELYDLIDRSENFCLMSPISYAGRKRLQKNARFLYAMTIEIDNIHPEYGLKELFYSWNREHDPELKPTYIVCSGNGIHLYFKFIHPVPLFANVFEQLSAVKKWMTPRYWNRFTTTMQDVSDIQWESLNQAFRLVGTRTKNGGYTAAFKVGDAISLEQLNDYLPKNRQINVIYKSNLTLKQAQKLYPDWYQRRIVEKQDRGHWTRHRGIYDNWKEKILNGAAVGHRYHCLENLCSLGVQCEISPEEIEADCYKIADFLETKTTDEKNHFTEYDVLCALQTYHLATEGAYRRRIDIISIKTGIPLMPNKRNGLKQEKHLYLARRRKADMKKIDIPMNGTEGRPQKHQIVFEWQQLHPDGRKSDCIRDTGLAKHTVYKWWDISMPHNEDVVDEKNLEDRSSRRLYAYYRKFATRDLF